jgi:hypothetical protein
MKIGILAIHIQEVGGKRKREEWRGEKDKP